MYRDFLTNKWVLGGIGFLVIFAGLCYLWYQHDTAPYRKQAAELDEIIHQSGQQQTASTAKPTEQAGDASAESTTPTAEKPKATAEVGTATTDEPVVKVSPFGLGPLPEIPKEWNAPYLWEGCDTIESELLTRVIIKMHNEGIRDKYSSVGINHGTGLITPIEYGSILVEYETDKNGEQRIMRAKGHPDLSPSQYVGGRLSEIPSHIKIVTTEEIAIDPYEYLGLQR